MLKYFIVIGVFTVTSQLALAQGSPSVYLANGQVDDLFGSIPADMNEYGKEQYLAFYNTFIGRTDLNAQLLTLTNRPACEVEEYDYQEGDKWLFNNMHDKKIVMFNENHYVPSSRIFVKQLLPQLRDMGFTHIGFEALDNTGSLAGLNSDSFSGYYIIEPNFSALLSTSEALGFEIFAYESTEIIEPNSSPEDQIRIRDQVQAKNIIAQIDRAAEDAKFIIFAGWSHIEEEVVDTPGSSGYRWMASYFKEQTGINPFTINLTQCTYESNSSEAWQGRIYTDDSGEAFVSGYYQNIVDAQIHLPVPSSEVATGFYRQSLGPALQIPESLIPEDEAVLIQAKEAGQNAFSVGKDIVLVKPGENHFLYLQAGEYTLTSHLTDGTLIGEERIIVE